MLEFYEMQSTLSLSSLRGLLSPSVVAPDKVISMDQIEVWHLTVFSCQMEMFEIELFDHLIACKNDWCLIELLVMHSNTWKSLTVCKQMIKDRLYYSYLIEMTETILLWKIWSQARLKYYLHNMFNTYV